MSDAFTHTGNALPAAAPGNEAEGSAAGHSSGPVEHGDASTIVQSTQRPGESCTSTHAAYGCPGQTACWPVQVTPPPPASFVDSLPPQLATRTDANMKSTRTLRIDGQYAAAGRSRPSATQGSPARPARSPRGVAPAARLPW